MSVKVAMFGSRDSSVDVVTTDTEVTSAMPVRIFSSPRRVGVKRLGREPQHSAPRNAHVITV